ncbi:MAG: MBL fold metallo-hydrolase [Desulfobacter sp.]|nr:MAG: MBL fold metallo-hydrolase [Desulfobacter sp.]
MKTHYIPEHRFPLVLTPRIRVLGNYFFNLVLITGAQKNALFETGVSGITDNVIAQLEKLDIAPDYLVVSHPHSDHITGLPGLMARFPGARVLAGRGASDFISHPKAGPALVKEDRSISLGLEKMGIRPGRPSLETVPDLAAAREIETETRLDLGGGTVLDLIPVKGHSPANLIARMEQDRALFCSDSLGFYFPGRALWPLFFTNARDYLATIDMIKAAAPAIICPAHQGPITGREAVNAPFQAEKEARTMISRIRKTRLPDEALIKELFGESYKDEFALYTETNIMNCTRLMIRRARE